jgi:hypothetical protein
MRKIAQVFIENIGSLFSLWYQSNKNSNEFDPKKKKKKKATPSLPKYLSHLNLANFMPLKLTSTIYLLWEIHESYHLMKVRLLVLKKMAKSMNQTWRHRHAQKGWLKLGLKPLLMHSRPNLAFGYNPRQV